MFKCEEKNIYLNMLDKLYSENKIEIISSTVIEKEQNKISDEKWKQKYKDRINELRNM
jgi:hypothetical protein